MSSGQCDFSANIFDPDSKGYRRIACDEPALQSKKCRFHDKDYLNENTFSEIHDAIYKKIEDACNNNNILECVGYHIPKINLESKKFSNQVFFAYSTFVDGVIFDDSEFKSFVDFTHCVFKNESEFNQVTFKEKVEFSSSVFENRASFESSKFEKSVDFSSTKFNKTSSFFTTEFTISYFSNARFYDEVSFGIAEFKEKTWFTNTIFSKEVKFNRVRFCNEINFSRTIFNKHADFRNSLFIKPDQVIFDSDLSHVSFLSTDISRIKFGNQVKWHIDSISSGKLSKFCNRIKKPNNKFIIYDEWLLQNNKEPTLHLEDILDVYRNLRENHDYYLKYQTAGEFFVREMELTRKYKKNKISGKKTISKKCYEKFSLYGLYNIISQYGHSIHRPVYISISILSIFMILFCMESYDNPKFSDLSFLDILSKAIFRSVTSFFPFYSLNNDANYLDIILRMLLLPLSGVFFIALKRRLERKYRH